MQLQQVLLSLLATGALAQAATESAGMTNQAEDEDHCEAYEGQQEEILPGYFVEYTCEKNGPYTERVSDITTAGGCAQLCKDKPGCSGSSWPARFHTCFLGSDADTKGEETRKTTLYMKNVTPPPATGGPSDGGASDGGSGAASVCNRLRDQCLQELQSSSCTCGGGNGGAGGNGDTGDTGGNEGTSQTGGDPNKKCCGYNDGAVVTHNGKKYNMYCNKLNDVGGADLKGWSNKAMDSPEACIQACSDYEGGQCKRAVWRITNEATGKTSCYLRGRNNQGCAATKANSYWHGAHVADCN